MNVMHALLRRQLKRYLGETEGLSDETQAFISAVNNAYMEFDADRRMLERSLELSSQELLQANSEMRVVLQVFPDLFIWLNSDGIILASKAGQVTDVSPLPESSVGKQIQDVLTPAIGDQFASAIQQVQRTQAIVSLEYSQSPNGHDSFYEARFLPLLDTQIIVIVRNISKQKLAERALHRAKEELERRVEERTAELQNANQRLLIELAERTRAEEALRESEERHRSLFETIAQGVIYKDSSGAITAVNPAAERILGVGADELTGAGDADKPTETTTIYED
jgi:transcriptional regulator with PAS, ATPase and Fis domain